LNRRTKKGRKEINNNDGRKVKDRNDTYEKVIVVKEYKRISIATHQFDEPTSENGVTYEPQP